MTQKPRDRPTWVTLLPQLTLSMLLCACATHAVPAPCPAIPPPPSIVIPPPGELQKELEGIFDPTLTHSNFESNPSRQLVEPSGIPGLSNGMR